MQGSFLRFYVNAVQQHHGVLLWEWLLDKGNKLGIRGVGLSDPFVELAGSDRGRVRR
jgi:PII-like signaling protein